MVKVRCPKCGKEWDFTGTKPKARCTNCDASFSIRFKKKPQEATVEKTPAKPKKSYMERVVSNDWGPDEPDKKKLLTPKQHAKAKEEAIKKLGADAKKTVDGTNIGVLLLSSINKAIGFVVLNDINAIKFSEEERRALHEAFAQTGFAKISNPYAIILVTELSVVLTVLMMNVDKIRERIQKWQADRKREEERKRLAGGR